MKVHFLRASRSRKSACPSFFQRLWMTKCAVILILTALAAGGPVAQLRGGQTTPVGTKRSSGNSQNGKLVYKSQGCDKCHGSYGEGLSTLGPNGGTPRIAPMTLALPTFMKSVRNPNGPMPPYGSHQLPDRDLTDVYAFLKSSTRAVEREASAPANPKSGQRLFTEYGCSECHLAQGQGSRSTKGTRLGPPQLPLSAFIRYVREPTREMPPYTQKTVTDQELTDIYAFLQSVPQPPSWKTILLLNQ